jgi:hypothetical protein
MVHHGYLFALERRGPTRMVREWECATQQFRQHIQLHLSKNPFSEATLHPVFVSTFIVGVVARLPSQHCNWH